MWHETQFLSPIATRSDFQNRAASARIPPDTLPSIRTRDRKQVNSIAEGGPNAGQLTRGIYEIIDSTHKRACWGPPGGPRPTEFKSPSGMHQILQYWKKIEPVPLQ